MMGYIMIFRFWRTTSLWHDRSFDKSEDLLSHGVRKNVVFVKNIPKFIDPLVGSVEIRKIL
jgi:hypothetical protein